jgi:peptide/nickel transport system ATP-binding protein
MTDAVADIVDLRIGPERGGAHIVDAVRLSVARGEVLGLVGASGSGKTTVALSLLGYLKPGLKLRSGTVRVAGTDPFATPSLRGRVVSYLSQDPIGALNPARRIGSLLIETMRQRLPGRPDAAIRRDIQALCERMELPAGRDFLKRFPHQLSGGQAQRIALAIALSGSPELLVLDEPTSMLDAATARDIQRLLGALLARGDTAAVLVSHNPGLVSALAHRVAVMREGTLVETGPSPATTAVANRAAPTTEVERPPRLVVEKLSARHGRTTVLDRVSFGIPTGGCVALVGPSGSGKSTTARCLVGLHRPSTGRIHLDGQPLAADYRKRSAQHRRTIQLIAQDAAGALNPRETVHTALLRPLRSTRGLDEHTANAELTALLARVRLPADIANRRPGKLSGGERQRVNLARAIATSPQILVCDEITSALDTSTAATVLDLIDTLRHELDLSVLLITHDLNLVASRADQMLVMSAGRIVETGNPAEVRGAPKHPATIDLIAASVIDTVTRPTQPTT